MYECWLGFPKMLLILLVDSDTTVWYLDLKRGLESRQKVFLSTP